MDISKSYNLFKIFFFLFFSISFAQGTIEVETGSSSVCEGSFIQLNFELETAIPGAFYNWSILYDNDGNGVIEPRDEVLNIENDGRADQLNLMGGQVEDVTLIGGASGNDADENSFVQFNLSRTARIFINVNGITDDIVINVSPAPNAGQEATVFLCNKTGQITLFDELGGDPDTGGTWTFNGSAHDGTFEIGSSEEGIYTYTVLGIGACPDTDSRVIVRECSNPDYDGDGVLNEDDLDDDNDGILDVNENSFCDEDELTPTQNSIDEDFGVGPPTQNANVSPILTYQIGIPQDINNNDGEYNVATSTYIFNFNNESANYVSVNANGHLDGDGNIDGRFLSINMLTGSFLNLPIYEQEDLPVTPGVEQVLSMKVANLNDNGGVLPNLTLQILAPDGNVIEEVTSGDLLFADDEWQEFEIPFTPEAGVEVVTLRVINTQTMQGNGNDVGIDNILLARLECDFDLDAVPNYLDLDSDNDGIYDAVEAGFNESQVNANGQLTGGVDADGVPIIANGGVAATSSSTVFADLSPDFINLDSDRDGCSDANEAYFDAEADGIIVSTNTSETAVYGIDPFDPADIVDFDGRVIAAPYTFPEDRDGDGVLDFQQNLLLEGGPDTNNNNIPDACDDSSDNDDDGVVDGLAGESDLDDDNDGILDINEYPTGVTADPLSESGGTLLYLDTTSAGFTDVNGDDVDDRFDFDLDGIINQFDVDSDNDGVYDHVEAGLGLVTGIAEEEDYGQIGDDTDVDSDGLLTGSGLTSADLDVDGLPNFLDIDADGDGILDNYEAQATVSYVAPSGLDTNENGADDAYDGIDALDPIETTEGTADYLNINSDDDCLDDVDEAYDLDQDGVSDIAETTDGNNDGLNDAYEGAPLVSSFPNNHDPSTPEVDYREEFIEEDEVIADPIILCATADPFVLFDELSELTTNENGTWSGPLASDEVFDWALDPSLDGVAGDYVYTLTLGDCESTYTLTIEVTDEPYAGDDNASATVCESELTAVPYSFLLGDDLADEGGTWTSADVAAADLPATFDGVLNLENIATGAAIELTYTVGSTECFDTAVVTLTKSTGRNAGMSQADIVLCGADTEAVDLFELLGDGAELGGTWTSTFNEGAAGSSDGTITPFGSAAGAYVFEYTLEATEFCEGISSTVSLEVTQNPYAGDDNADATICESELTTVPFDFLLGVDPANEGGTWTSTDIAAADLPTTFNGALNLANIVTGTSVALTYTVGIADCEDSATITLTKTTGRNAGASQQDIILCGADTEVVDLFELLGGAEEGGTWTSVFNGGTADSSDGTIRPSVAAAGAYVFEYTLEPTTVCEGASSTISLEVLEAPIAGTPVTGPICSSTESINLFDSLDEEDEGGVWTNAAGTEVDGANLLIANFIDGDVLTYTVGIADCSATAEVTLNIITTPNGGESVSKIYCQSTSTPIVLFDLFENTDMGGTWDDGSDETLSVDPSALAEGNFTFTYTLAAVGGCEAVTSEVIVAITPEIYAGEDTDEDLCISGDSPTFDLVDLLEVETGRVITLGGIWSLEGSEVDATINIENALPGTYEYTYNVATSDDPNCVPDSAILTLTLTKDRAAGDDQQITVCANHAGTIDLFNLLNLDGTDGTDGTDGAWRGSAGSSDPTGDHLGTIDPSSLDAGEYIYTYTLPATFPCLSDEVFVMVTILEAPDFVFVGEPICTIDRITYSVAYTSNLDASVDWDINITSVDGYSSVGAASIDETSSMIIDIPAGVEVELTAVVSDPSVIFNNESCTTSFVVPRSDCPCEAIDPPVANDALVQVCEGDPNPTLSVDVPLGMTANWYLQFEDAGLPLTQGTTFVSPEVNAGGYTYWARTYDPIANCESEDFAIIEFDIIGLPVVDLPATSFFCTDAAGFASDGSSVNLDAQLSEITYEFQWHKDNLAMLNETNSTINIDEIGTYYVEYSFVSVDGLLSCSARSNDVVVSGIEEPVLELSLGEAAFANEPSIVATVVNASPFSEYEYTLDGLITQESPVFENVEPGMHEVVVTDLVGCGDAVADIYVIGFPKFFTPNGDNNNEFWNVNLDPAEPMDMSIFIYDRFGKLLTQIFPNDLGWDGKFAGRNLPSNDYWFIAKLNNSNETYTGHFSLIR